MDMNRIRNEMELEKLEQIERGKRIKKIRETIIPDIIPPDIPRIKFQKS